MTIKKFQSQSRVHNQRLGVARRHLQERVQSPGDVPIMKALLCFRMTRMQGAQVQSFPDSELNTILCPRRQPGGSRPGCSAVARLQIGTAHHTGRPNGILVHA